MAMIMEQTENEMLFVKTYSRKINRIHSRLEVLCKGILRNFSFTGKSLCQTLFFK